MSEIYIHARNLTGLGAAGILGRFLEELPYDSQTVKVIRPPLKRRIPAFVSRLLDIFFLRFFFRSIS